MSGSSVSVAMCTYSGANYVREQLESIARQTRRPDELVVCDDGSRDTTLDIVDDFARRAPFAVRVVSHRANVGVTANFEHAISLCSKDMIFLCDQDDVWHADKIETTACALDGFPDACGAFSDSAVVDSNLQPAGYSLWDTCGFTPPLRSAFGERAVEMLLDGNKVQGAALAFRASCRSILLPISRRWTYDAWLAVILAACGLLVIDRELMQYRQHQENWLGAEVQPKLTRLERQLHKFRRLRRYYVDKLRETNEFLVQLDELDARLSLGRDKFSKALAATSERRRRLEKRRRRSALWCGLLGAS